MYDDDNSGIPKKKSKKKRDPVRFAPKIIEARNEREEKIELLQKDILSLIEKSKIDDRDVKVALQKLTKLINARCKI